MDKQENIKKALDWWQGLDSNTQDDLSEKWILDYYVKNIKEEK